MDIIIYGAQGYALGAYKAIESLHPDWHVLFFMVTAKGSNADELGGLPVREIESVCEEYSEVERRKVHVLVATPENVQEDIESILKKKGFCDYSRLTSEKWGDLMSEYNTKTRLFPPLRDFQSDRFRTPIVIYMAKHHGDRELRNQFTLPEYMNAIQVGAANTKEIIADIRDNSGDNISTKNSNYCELTGLYWVWKNVLCDSFGDDTFYGFAQYRRTLILSNNDISKLGVNDVDVVLPYPLMYEPDISMHHNRYIAEADWKAMLQALDELQPEYTDVFGKILKQQYMYNYNIILARKAVLRDYCEWLFPILARTEELSVPKGSERSDRYIGYMAETLETLYFMKNSDKLRIAHTGCKMHI